MTGSYEHILMEYILEQGAFSKNNLMLYRKRNTWFGLDCVDVVCLDLVDINH